MVHRLFAIALFVAVPLTAQPSAGQVPAGPPPGATQFDYLLGEWRFAAVSKTQIGPGRFGGTWKAWKSLDGWGVEDEYRIVDPTGTTRYLGYTVRLYIPATDSWKLSYADVFRGTFHEQFAKREGDGMSLRWTASDQQGEFQVRVRYFDIAPQSFRWQQDRSYDGGKTWIEQYITIQATRTAAAARR